MAKPTPVACPSCEGEIVINEQEGGRGTGEATSYYAQCKRCTYSQHDLASNCSGRRSDAIVEFNRIVKAAKASGATPSCALRARPGTPSPGHRMGNFQAQAGQFLDECIGEELAADPVFQAERFLEKALILARAAGASRARARTLLSGVFELEAAEVDQSTGATMLRLATLSRALGIEMTDAGAKELRRCDDRISILRAEEFAVLRDREFAAEPESEIDEPFKPQWPEGLKPNEAYQVLCDDKGRNGTSFLNVMVANDGDVHVGMQDWEDPQVGAPDPFPTLRCRTYSGGGRNARTHQALLMLAQAIRLDHEERQARGKLASGTPKTTAVRLYANMFQIKRDGVIVGAATSHSKGLWQLTCGNEHRVAPKHRSTSVEAAKAFDSQFPHSNPPAS